MSKKFFAKNRKKIFTAFFGVVFFAAIFWLTQLAPRAEAISCSSGCDTKSSGECIWDWGQAADNTLQGRKTCSVGANYYDVWDFYDGWETSCDSGSGAKKCQTGQCPSSTVNGASCTIIEPSGTILSGGCSKSEITGKWDANEGKCIQCSSNKEIQIYGDTSSLITKSGDNKFDSACNALVTACDEKGPGDSCSLPIGGTCDANGKCVAASGSSCTAAAPTITVAPNSYNGPASTQTFSISATRKDSSGCASKSIPLTVNCTAGNTPSWTSGSTLATAYNGTGTQTVDVAITASGSCTMTAKSPDDNTKNASSTVGITVSPLACPKGSGAGSATSFAVDFKQPTFIIGETFKISYMIPPEDQGGAICIYAPGASSPSYSKNETSTTTPKTNSNYDTGYKPTSAGTWKVTISKGSFCSVASTCFATVEVTSTAPPPPPPPPGGGGPANLTITANPSTITQGSTTPITFTVTDASGNVSGAEVAISGVISASCSDATGSDGKCTASVAATSTGTATATASKTGYTSGSTTITVAVVTTPPGPCASGTTNYRSPLSYCSIQDLIQGATGWILGLVSSIAILFLVYGGIMYTMAAGDETKMESAKNIIYYAILGLAIILISYTLITEVKTILKVKEI